MEKAIKLSKSNKAYIKIFNNINEKYKIYGKITGSFTIEAKNSEEKKALQNFDTNVISTGKAKISSAKVKKLYEKKFGTLDFIKLMEEVLGIEAITNKEIQEVEDQRKKDFFNGIIESSNEGIGKEWFKAVVNEKVQGYRNIIIRYNEAESTEEIINVLITFINAVNNLPYLRKEFESIVLFAAKETKDPHYFDLDRFQGNLLINLICNIFKRDNPVDVVEINELYYLAGLLKDEISNTTTIYGIKAFKGNEEVISLEEFNRWEEPLEISISNILKIDKFVAKGENVYIFENPTVFYEVLKKVKGKASLICTKGQLNLSSHLIIEKLKNINNIYYGGDFDPEGLVIANNLRAKYGEKIKFLLYNKENYKKIKSSIILDDSRIKKLNNINQLELEEIKECIIEDKNSAYQELLIDEYIEFINSRIRF